MTPSKEAEKYARGRWAPDAPRKREESAKDFDAGIQSAQEWIPIETAPKGYPGMEEPSEWFLGFSPVHGEQVIRRHFNIAFGPWGSRDETYYKADQFTHWMPLPPPPSGEKV